VTLSQESHLAMSETFA